MEHSKNILSILGYFCEYRCTIYENLITTSGSTRGSLPPSDQSPEYNRTPNLSIGFRSMPLTVRRRRCTKKPSVSRPWPQQRLGLCGNLFVEDRKSTRLNSSHRCISYAVFCL